MTTKAQIVVSAVDKASATMLRIRAEMRAMTQPMRDVKASFGRFTEASGLKQVGRDMQKIARTARSVASGVTSIVAPMGALIGVGTVAGLGELTRRWASLGWNVSRTAQTIGVAPTQLMALQGAAKLAGLSADDMTSSLGALGTTLQDAEYGRNQQAMYALNQLGVSIHRTASGAVDTTRALSDLSAVIQRYNGQPQVQQRIADQFGLGSLLPLLRQGPAAIRRFEAEARRLGYTLNDGALRRSEQLGQSFAKLELSLDGLRNSIADSLYPVMQPMLNSFVQWISANRVLIGQKVSDWVGAVVRWVKSVNWMQVWSDIRQTAEQILAIVRGINSAVQSIGGWKTTLELAFGAWAIGKLSMFTLAVLRVASAFGKVRAAATAASVAAGASEAGAAASGGLLAAAGAGAVGAGLMLYSPPVGAGEQSALNARLNSLPARQQRALWRLQQMGLSPIEAAGLVANFTAESGLNASSVGDKGSAYGIGQWHPDRQAQFKKLFGIPIQKSDLDQQLAFARWELGNTESGAQARAARARTAGEAGSIYSRYYERPKNADLEANTRAVLAEDIYNQNRMMFTHAPAQKEQVEVSMKNMPPGTRVEARDDKGNSVPAPAQKVQVEVSMKNMPPGTRVEARDDKGNSVPARVAYNMVGLQW